MYRISKEFHFSASHVLSGLREGHPCGRMHGHNYVVIIELRSWQLGDTGFIVDYNDLRPLSEYIDRELDHRHLNDVFDFQPSAENLARHFYEWCRDKWPETYSVTVKETPKTAATFTGYW